MLGYPKVKIALLLTIILYIAKLVLETYALNLVIFLIKGWTRLYTLAAPECEREALRAQVNSELHESIAIAREEGYTSVQIAVLELFRWLSGSVGDLIWAAPLILESLPEKLERGSEVIRRFKTPALIIAILGTFLMINSLGLFADEGRGNELLLLNFYLVVAAVLFWKQEQRWARAVLLSLPAVVIVGLIGLFITLGVMHQVYNHPLFLQLVLEGGIIMLPVAATAFWVSDTCRVRMFKGSWLAVALCIGISFIISSSLAFALVRDPWSLMLIWGVVGVATILLVAMSWSFALGTAALCSGILRTTAFAMMVLAVAMRRLG